MLTKTGYKVQQAILQLTFGGLVTVFTLTQGYFISNFKEHCQLKGS